MAFTPGAGSTLCYSCSRRHISKILRRTEEYQVAGHHRPHIRPTTSVGWDYLSTFKALSRHTMLRDGKFLILMKTTFISLRQGSSSVLPTKLIVERSYYIGGRATSDHDCGLRKNDVRYANDTATRSSDRLRLLVNSITQSNSVMER